MAAYVLQIGYCVLIVLAQKNETKVSISLFVLSFRIPLIPSKQTIVKGVGLTLVLANWAMAFWAIAWVRTCVLFSPPPSASYCASRFLNSSWSRRFCKASSCCSSSTPMSSSSSTTNPPLPVHSTSRLSTPRSDSSSYCLSTFSFPSPYCTSPPPFPLASEV
jgi:hypothetical protein